MTPKHWTILIVPPGNGRTRSIEIGPRTRRVLIGGAWAAGVLVFAAAFTLFTPYATPTARVLMAQNERLRTEMGVIDSRLSALGDTLASLGARDQQIRLLAGLAVDSNALAANANALAFGEAGSGVMPARLAGAHLAKPFLGRLGFEGRTDIDTMIQRAAALSASFTAVSDTLTRNLERLANTPSIMPTTGWLSSHFSLSRFHPILHENRPHEGIDVSAPMGAPIVAPASGTVMSVTFEPGYGNTFQVDHGNGIVTKFAHCSRILVRAGQHVTRGQLIATVGNTGLSTGPHLHYEVHVNGKPVDPLKFVVGTGQMASIE